MGDKKKALPLSGSVEVAENTDDEGNEELGAGQYFQITDTGGKERGLDEV